MKISRLIICIAISYALVCLLLGGCMVPSEKTTLSDEVIGFRIARKLAYYDWTVDPVDRNFSDQELIWLERNKMEIEKEIAIFIQDYSTPAVLVAGHLKLESCLPVLRGMLLTLRSPCGESGGDGADYTLEETYLRDNMFPYHVYYIDAIENITGLPIHKAVTLTNEEAQRLLSDAEKASVDGNIFDPWCAKWLLLKLQLLPNNDK